MLKKLLYSLLIPFVAFMLHAQCTMLGISTYIGPCNNGVYTISGSISFSNPPFSGQLIVQTSSGQYDTLYPPFASGSANYVLEDIPAIGGAQTITAHFTFFPNCSISINISNIPTCPCTIANVSADVSSCDNQTNTFNISGVVEFLTPPTTGTLTVSDCSGNSQTFDHPFVSPINYSLNNIFANATPNCAVTASFSTNANCSFTTETFDYPQLCNCDADAGTVSINPSGLSNTLGELCFNDMIQIISNNDFIPPSNIGGNVPYNPNVGLLLYSCQPTIFQYDNIYNDPCLIGLVQSQNDSWTLTNTLGDGSLVYVVPVTLYNTNPDIIFNPEFVTNCYDMGEVVPIRYLPQVTASYTSDCQNSTLAATISGGSPAVNSSVFTAQNLLPNTASFVNTTCNNNGTIIVTGLQNGDNFSFDIVDQNGCGTTVSGVYEGLLPVFISYPNTSYCANDDNPEPEIDGALGGSFSSSSMGLIINNLTGVINLQASSPGQYTVFYQTPELECYSIASFQITVHAPQVVVQNHNICEVDMPVVLSGFTFTESGQESILFTDVNGCDSTVVINVEVIITPIPVIQNNISEGCTPLEVTFLNLTEGQYSSCAWDFGTPNGLVNQCGNINHVFNQEGCFDVSLAVTNSFGCTGIVSFENLICAIATPDAQFLYNPTEININDPQVQFINLSTNTSESLWFFEHDSSSSNVFSPNYLFPEQAGYYAVTLTAFNEYCVDSITQIIQITDKPIYYVPNSFSPNGDGVNEIFMPQFYSGFDDRFYTMTIFNRWGELIFETNNHLQGWDGTMDNAPVQEGVYIFAISFKHTENEDVTLIHGHIALMR